MAIRTFPDIRKFSWKSTKELSWGTTVATAGSGRVRTLTNRKYPKWTIVTKFQTLTDEERKTISGFINSIKGAYEAFFFLDPEDNHETNIQLPMVETGRYQFIMKMGEYVQPVYKVDDVKMYIDGTLVPSNAYTISGGVVTFRDAPAASSIITATYTYYWKVMLQNDNFKITVLFHDIYQSDNLTMETVE